MRGLLFTSLFDGFRALTNQYWFSSIRFWRLLLREQSRVFLFKFISSRNETVLSIINGPLISSAEWSAYESDGNLRQTIKLALADRNDFLKFYYLSLSFGWWMKLRWCRFIKLNNANKWKERVYWFNPFRWLYAIQVVRYVETGTHSFRGRPFVTFLPEGKAAPPHLECLVECRRVRAGWTLPRTL